MLNVLNELEKQASIISADFIEKSAARKLDKVINQIAASSKEPLEKLEGMAYQLFGRNKRHIIENDIHRQALPNISANIFADDHDKLMAYKDILNKATDSSKILKPVDNNNFLKNRYQKYSEQYKSEAEPFKNFANSGVKKYIPHTVNNEIYTGINNVDPEKLIDIEHGGGYNYLQDLFKGKSKGYSLENHTGNGIQVSPVSDVNLNRSQDYAARTSFYNDSPAVLKGQIQAKYLQKAPNNYEAGLRTENLKHIQNLEINKVDNFDLDQSKKLPYVHDEIKKYVKNKYYINL